MSIEIITKLKELAEKGITDIKEAIGYLESEFKTEFDPAPLAPLPEVDPAAPAAETPAA